MPFRTACCTAVLIVLVSACPFPGRAQSPDAARRTPIDPAEVVAAAAAISGRAEHLKPMFDEVQPAEWVAKGAPQAYVAQWASLNEQNGAVETDMASVSQRAASKQEAAAGASLEQVLQALFRLHRFDSDLDGLLKAVRRYQNPALADLIESVAADDQTGMEKLQQYALDLSAEKDRQLDLVNQEAQRCRSLLASQPAPRPAAQRKSTSGPSK